MLLSDIPVGTRLELTWVREGSPDSRRSSAGPPLVSQLLEPAVDGTLLIASPIIDFRPVDWPQDLLARLEFSQPDDGIWSVTVRFIQDETTNRIAAFQTKATGPLRRRQRRAWYRLPCALDITLKLPEDAAKPFRNPELPLAIRGVTRDISGGGAAFVTSQIIPTEIDEVELVLAINPDQSITARGRIIRVADIDGQPGRRQVSLQFTDIEKRDQDHLARFVLQQQRQSLNRW